MEAKRLGRLRYARGSLKLRLALAGIVLIGPSVAFTVFFVLRDMGERTERAILDIPPGAIGSSIYEGRGSPIFGLAVAPPVIEFRLLALRRVKEGEKPSEVVKSLGM